MTAFGKAEAEAAGRVDPGARQTDVNLGLWARVSPLIDEFDGLDAATRVARLAELQAQDPALANTLCALLQRMDTLDDEPFMQRTPVPRGPPEPGSALAGKRIGAYMLDRLLGQGGMGSVWLARRTDGRYDGEVAIKFLRGGLFGHGDEQRFAREGRILAQLDHPNIARLLDAGLTPEDQPYLVLEYVPGLPIDRHCDQAGLDLRARLLLFMDVLAAVSHAHERLVLHRDLKPSNILVTQQGKVKLLDFGIAKLVSDAAEPPDHATQLTHQAGQIFTPLYAAPEQVQGGLLTTATDVYALGVLLYTLLSGSHPTAATATTAPLDRLRAVVEVQPQRLSQAVSRRDGAPSWRTPRALRGDLDTVVAQALKKRPSERYRNAAELADDLRRYLAHEPVAARPDGVVYRAAKFVRRNRLGVAMGGSVALALAAAAAVALVQAREATEQRLLANGQRVQAEGLIEFMLGDLRDKLEPVGRLDVLDAVSSKALGYYANQDAKLLDADAMSRRAKAMKQIGLLDDLRGRLDDAERNMLAAAAITADLLARAPNQAQRLADHADSENDLALVATRRLQYAAAEAAHLRALDLQRRAMALRPGVAELEIGAATIGVDLGILYVDTDRGQLALPILQEALDTHLRLIESRPALAKDILNIRSTLGDAYYGLGQYRKAIEVLDGHWHGPRQPPAGEVDLQLVRLRVQGLNRLAGSYLRLGLLPQAEEVSREVVAQEAALVRQDPSNLDQLNYLSYHRLLLAEILIGSGRGAAARAELEAVAAAIPTLSTMYNGTPIDTLNLRAWRLALAAQLVPPPADVWRELQDTIGEVQVVDNPDKPLSRAERLAVAWAGLVLGEGLSAQGRHADAAAAWRTASAVVQALAQDRNHTAMGLMGLLRLRQGDRAAAAEWAARLKATDYRHPNYTTLQRRLARLGRPI